jgi:hypothetical protein
MKLFKQIISGFVVGLKQKVQGWEVRGCRHTGLSFGSGDEVFTLYDKAVRMKTNDGKLWARIECNLAGDKLPIQHLDEIPLLLQGILSGEFQPFRHANFFDVQLINEQELWKLPDTLMLGQPIGYAQDGSWLKAQVTRAIRYGELRALVNFAGYGTAKKILNPSRNFARDYKPLIASMNPILDLNALFEQSMTAFLAGYDAGAVEAIVTRDSFSFQPREANL